MGVVTMGQFTTMSALAHWAESLPRWAIPPDILGQAPQSPWIHPVASFTPSGDLHVATPSRLRALEALPDGGTVLDVGCGGGRAAFGLVPPAARVVGVDHQQGMLDVFAREAAVRGVECTTILGDWPDVAHLVPVGDVVTCHHVVYNVADLAPFLAALDAHARRRVVLELPERHPLSGLSPLWKAFWNLDRPDSPTADDALAAVREAGYPAAMEFFTAADSPRAVTDTDVENTRIRLCLPAERDPDIRRHLEEHPAPPRRLATIWWDTTG